MDDVTITTTKSMSLLLKMPVELRPTAVSHVRNEVTWSIEVSYGLTNNFSKNDRRSIRGDNRRGVKRNIFLVSANYWTLMRFDSFSALTGQALNRWAQILVSLKDPA